MRGEGVSIAAIICAAGSSSRMGGNKKEYQQLKSASPEGIPLSVLGVAVSAFVSCSQISPIVIVLPEREKAEDRARFQGVIMEELRLLDPYCNPVRSEPQTGKGQSRILFVQGGPSRRISVHKALAFLEEYNPSYVLIHDGARPWIKKALIEKIINAVQQYGAVIPAIPMTETPKELFSPLVSDNQHVSTVPDTYIKRHLRRAELCVAQTPQGFKFPEILGAHEKAAEREERGKFEYTDDAELWADFIGKVAVISGDAANRKITYPEDLR